MNTLKMFRFIITFLFIINVVQAHHIIKILLSYETSKYNDRKYCGFNHMKSIVTAFKNTEIKNMNNTKFCSLCDETNFFKEKYHKNIHDVGVESVVEDVKNITKTLNLLCPTWDEDLRAKNFNDMLKWIIQKRKLEHKKECLSMVKTLISQYKSKKDKELMQIILEILSDERFRLGWAGIVADFESKDMYLNSCFNVINAFTYFKPHICSSGSFATFLQHSCPSSCLKVESRLVSNALNDCCNKCVGDITLLNETEKDLIDIRPFNKWKSII